MNDDISPTPNGSESEYRGILQRMKQRESTVDEYITDLISVKERRLYLFDCDSWEQFCKTHTSYSRRWVDQIASSKGLGTKVQNRPEVTSGLDKVAFTSKLGTKVQNRPEVTSGQAPDIKTVDLSSLSVDCKAKLATVPDRLRDKVVQEASKSGPITFRSVREAIQKVKDEDPVRVDCTNFIIPPELVELFDRRNEIVEMRKAVSQIRSSLRRAQEADDRLYRDMSMSMVISELDAVYTSLGNSIPFALCPYCQGVTRDHCKACRGRGFISEHFYKHVCDPELITVRDKVIAQRREKEEARP